MGLGKVGSLVATLLHKTGFEVVGADIQDNLVFPFPVKKTDFSGPVEFDSEIKRYDAVVSCLPYHFNIGLASAAHRAGIHYFDLTEDVQTTRAIIKMSNSANAVMAPQCGLAPGFIAIIGADLVRNFEKIRSLS